MKTKICTNCKKRKAISKFHKRLNLRDEHDSWCKECRSKSSKKYYKENKNKRTKTQNKWEKRNPNYRKEYGLKRYYNMTLEDHEQMYLKQNGCCAICDVPIEYNNIKTDHDHKTGKVRGLLCARCNHLLAGLDDVEFFNRAMVYLDEQEIK